MSKIHVVLKDKGSIFFDASQSATITGKNAVVVNLTLKVQRALKSSVIVEISAAEAKTINAEIKAEKDAARDAYALKGVDPYSARKIASLESENKLLLSEIGEGGKADLKKVADDDAATAAAEKLVADAAKAELKAKAKEQVDKKPTPGKINLSDSEFN